MISLNYINQQPAEGLDYAVEGSLYVHSVFPTMQGEGPLAGMPAIFVRLSDCNLACPKCDTDYTSVREQHGVSDLFERVLKATYPDNTGINLIVLTGGEPFRQNIVPFIIKAVQHFSVQVETNGTLWLDGLPLGRAGFSIVCSPKTPKVHPVIQQWATFKYILKAGEEDSQDGLPTQSLDSGLRPARPENMIVSNIFVQPLDEGDPKRNELNAEACVKTCMKYGYRLSMQLHKVLGLA